MPPALQSDWKTHPLPAKRVELSLNHTFTQSEMDYIRNGVIPGQMEDKWFIYFADDALYFHRSWTGFCIYIARLAQLAQPAQSAASTQTPGEQTWQLIFAEINADETQHILQEPRYEASMIYYLIDVLLLQRPGAYPESKSEPETQSIELWSTVGRAMRGEHPNAR